MEISFGLFTFTNFLWTAAGAAAVYALFELVRWRRKTFSYFEEIGIPGPKPNLIWGNLAEYHGKGFVNAIAGWCHKYGDIFGFYNGDVPTLVIKDLDFVAHVLVQDFQTFRKRARNWRLDQEHSFLGKAIIHADGLAWKRSRSCLSQAFTVNKLKQMVPVLSGSADVFMDIVEEKAAAGGEWPMLDALQTLAMDYIGRAGFGFGCCFQRDPSNRFMEVARGAFHDLMTGTLHAFAQSTTTFGPLVAPILWLNEKFGYFSYEIFNKHTSAVIELRMSDPKAKRPDMLQVMLDNETDETQNSNADGLTTRSMTLEEISVNTTSIILAGFETTGTTLGYTKYVLAKYPEVQERVREEVFSALKEYGELNYTTVMQGLKYLSNVVAETLRLYPPGVMFTTRCAVTDFHYKGIDYKAGTCVIVPTYEIHMDPRYWPDPEKFDPDRFLPESVATRPAVAYHPFGHGPRNCIAKRMALLEVMYTIARLLQRYRLTLGETQKGKMEMDFYGPVSAPARKGPYIRVHKI